MKFQRSLFAAVLAISALGAASLAQARSDVSWSIGIGIPGVQVYGGAPQPLYVQPAPVYYQQPAPVYYQPEPIYVRPAPVYYQPQPVVYQRPPVYVQPQVVYPPWGHRWHHRGWDNGRGYGEDRDNDWRR
ncbi:MAG: hypothetical protein H7172_06505 [Ferruginibacter sp.]|nr:hypothetical protein [Rhodoferax sp.]